VSAARRRDVETFLRHLRALDDILAERGYPRISPWWWRTLERFYRSGKRRLAVRKGRRVGASTIVAPRLAVAEMLWGEHPHTPGAPPLVFAFLSVKRGEAANRLRGVKAILDVLGEKYDEAGDTIELRDRPAIFAVVTANFRTSVGDTVAFAWCDEVARWHDDASGANPAEPVVASLAPALATLPDARLYLVSTPLSTVDYHAKQIDRGETETTCIAVGATWEINPTLTEEETRTLEPDERLWRREYGAVPSDAITESWFGEDLVNAAVDPGRGMNEPVPGRDYFGSIDGAAAGGGDQFVIAIGHRETGEGDAPARTVIDLVQAWRAPTGGTLSIEDTVSEAAATFRRFNDPYVVADQWSFVAIQEAFARHGMHITEAAWTAQSKPRRFYRVRAAMADRLVRLPDDAATIREFKLIRSRYLPTGTETIEARAGAHDDRVSAVVLVTSEAMDREPDTEERLPSPPAAPEALTAAWYEEQERQRMARWQAEFDAEREGRDPNRWITEG
jgi:hypothetical protein